MKCIPPALLFPFLALVLSGCTFPNDQPTDSSPVQISGIYPHLAYYNEENECGTGALVTWADRLWVITYGPHLPNGSSDKLYEITHDLTSTPHPLSIGGTPANRLIHSESDQLFIGPYAINKTGKVRVIPYQAAPGRFTGTARHLFQPEEYVYIGTMEEGFYEVNVHTLASKTLYKDSNGETGDNYSSLLPGAHGKGLYSGQGVLVYSNNGEPSPEALEKFDIESGVLAEWDGTSWAVVRRNQFVEVTGPGGIYGNLNPDTDPLWVTGWDHKSILLGTRDASTQAWSFYRLPKASHSYDGAHGWNTEWPRIRDVGTPENPDYLMTMHGMFWRFPSTFSASVTEGIRPRSAYLKVIGDFTRWNNQLVFGTDDSAKKEFLNKRKIKGNIEGAGQSNSNLWFTSPDMPDQLGPATASGSVWLEEEVQAKTPSEPFLFAGWPKRGAWIYNHTASPVQFTFEVQEPGMKIWQRFMVLILQGGESQYLSLDTTADFEWIRVQTDVPATATVHFSYADIDTRPALSPPSFFSGLAPVGTAPIEGLLYGTGDNRRTLGLSTIVDGELKYYELNGALELLPKPDTAMAAFIQERFAIPKDVITIDEASVLIIDDSNRRWRLPMGDSTYSSLTNLGMLRLAREVVTERDLFNVHGTFYELPAENADGFAKIRPISSHSFQIHDFTSYRGLFVMTGVASEAQDTNSHIIRSEDGNAAVWVGAIDDLWKLGKPIGHGGPWKDTSVRAGIPSDPYLFGFYDQRHLELTHNHDEPVQFTIELEPIGHGPWMLYETVIVEPGDTFRHTFPIDLEARWIRFRSDKSTTATAVLRYE